MKRTILVLLLFFAVKYIPAQTANADFVPADSAYKGDSSEVLLYPQQEPDFKTSEGDLLEYMRKRIEIKGDGQEPINLKTVYISFVIEKDGAVSNVYIRKSSGNANVDWQVKGIIERMPAWQPGMQNGVVVRTGMVVPIRFEHY